MIESKIYYKHKLYRETMLLEDSEQGQIHMTGGSKAGLNKLFILLTWSQPKSNNPNLLQHSTSKGNKIWKKALYRLVSRIL